MNKKTISIAGIFLAVALIALGVYFYNEKVKQGEPLLGGVNDVKIARGVQTRTSTTAVGLPVKVLAKNPSRNFCLIINDSDTDIYLTFANFDTSLQAVTSTGQGYGGIRINANGGSYECENSRMIVSEIWASSSASGKYINAIEN